MKKPTLLVRLGSGREGWLSIELDSLRFVLEVENGKRTVETLSLCDLKNRLPNIAGLVAEVIAEAVRSHSGGLD
jgi:hypothetical protein